MKKLLFILCLICSITSKAQIYHPLLDSVNEWCYTGNIMPVNIPDTFFTGPCFYPQFLMGPSAKIFTGSDTTIGSFIYKTLEYTDYYYNQICRYGYIREDTASRKVYFINNQFAPEIILYDFGMQLTDTISLTFLNSPGYYETGLYQLDSIVPYNTPGNSTRAFYLNCISCSSALRTVEWLEGIGNRLELALPLSSNIYMGGGLFYCGPFISYPFDGSQVLTSFQHNLRVFYDTCALQNAISNSCFEFHDTCSYWNICGSVAEFQTGPAIKVQPNPAVEIIYITTNTTKEEEINLRILNLNGISVLNAGVDFLSKNKERKINVSNLKEGVYFIEATGNSGRTYKKFIVNKR